MKLTNKKFSTIEELSQRLNLDGFDKDKTLLQIFSGFIKEVEVKKIQSIIKEKNRDIIFIGTSTAGEIFEGQSIENSISIAIMEFEDTIIKEDFFIDKNDFALGREIGSKLFSEKTKVMILFIDGLKTNGNDLIDGISSINNSIPLAGGLAAEDGHLEETFIFDKNGVYSKGCVAAALDSDVLNVYTEYQLNWKAIGQTMTVTKAEKNRLYELNGVNVSEMYTKYLGKNVGDNLPYSAIEFPLLKIDEDGLEICRTFTYQFEEDKSLLTIGNLEVGDKVRFSFGNIDLILKNTKNNLKKYSSIDPDGIFIYSCAARKSLLQSKSSQELLPLNRVASNIGFFTYGEIFHTKNKNLLLNESFTLLALSEKSLDSLEIEEEFVVEEKKIDNFLTDKHFLLLDALTNLTSTVIMELEEAQQQLLEQSHKDFLTGLYNRRYFYEIAKNFIKISQREKKQSSVISIDIDKFKKINDTYGHAIGDKVLKKLAEILMKNTRSSDVVARFGGEEFIILLPLTNIQGAYELAEKLRVVTQDSKVKIDNGDIVTFTISLGISSIDKSDSIEEFLHRADKALYAAKTNGRNRVVTASNENI